MPAPRSAAPPARNPAFLPPTELLRLGGLDLVSRLVADGFLAGRHRSASRGGSLEFAEHRAYVRGDDLRRVDWKVFARTDRFFMRESEAETNLRAMLLLDASASMGFSTDGRPTKLRYAAAMAAALAHLLLQQHDAVGLASFGEELHSFLPPRGGASQRTRILTQLEALAPKGETSPEGPFRELAERVPRRGLLLLLSDLMGPPERFVPGLQFFRHRGHEVIVFQLLDPGERSLEALGDVGRLRDAESGRIVDAVPAVLASGYRRELAALEAEYRHQAHERGFDFASFSTDEPLGVALARYLGRRRGGPRS